MHDTEAVREVTAATLDIYPYNIVVLNLPLRIQYPRLGLVAIFTFRLQL